jgi:hypothetical protein
MLTQRQNQIEGGVWRDQGFLLLDSLDQWLYLLLLDSGVNDAGVVALTPRRWARHAGDVSEQAVVDALERMSILGWIVIDHQMEELYLPRVAEQVSKRTGGVAILEGALASVHSPAIFELIHEHLAMKERR